MVRIIHTSSPLRNSLFVVVKSRCWIFRDHGAVLVNHNLILPVFLPLVKYLLFIRYIFLPFLIGEYLVLPFEDEIAEAHLKGGLGVEHLNINV